MVAFPPWGTVRPAPTRPVPTVPDTWSKEGRNPAGQLSTAQGLSQSLLAIRSRPSTGWMCSIFLKKIKLNSSSHEGREERSLQTSLLSDSPNLDNGQGDIVTPRAPSPPGSTHISASGPLGVFMGIPMEGQMHPQDLVRETLPALCHVPASRSPCIPWRLCRLPLDKRAQEDEYSAGKTQASTAPSTQPLLPLCPRGQRPVWTRKQPGIRAGPSRFPPSAGSVEQQAGGWVRSEDLCPVAPASDRCLQTKAQPSTDLPCQWPPHATCLG